MPKFREKIGTPLALNEVFSRHNRTPKAENYRNDVSYMKNRIASFFDQIATRLNSIKHEEDEVHDMTLALELMPQNMPERVKGIVEDRKAESEERIRSITRTVRAIRLDTRQTFERFRKETKKLIVLLENTPPPKTITAETIIQAVADHPFVLKRGVRYKPKLLRMPGGQVFLVFILHNLKMTPRSNNTTLVNKGGPIAPMPLGKVKVIISLSNGYVRLETVGSDPQHYQYNGWGRGRKVHPHVLRDSIPCMGDFAPPFSEALDNFDFPTVVDIICAFLETADPQDGAGFNWVRWVDPSFSRGERNREYTYNGFRYQQNEAGYFDKVTRDMDIAEAEAAAAAAQPPDPDEAFVRGTILRRNMSELLQLIQEAH